MNARTSPFLAACRKLFNAPIYKALLAEHKAGGEEACRAWLAARLLSTDPVAVLAGNGGGHD